MGKLWKAYSGYMQAEKSMKNDGHKSPTGKYIESYKNIIPLIG